MQESSKEITNIDPILYELFEFKPRKGDLKKVEIMKAAIVSLSTLGVEKTSFESIAKLIGTRRAHIAYHFSEKHDIYKGAIKYILATYQQVLMEQLSHAKTGIEMLERYVKAGFSWAENNPNQVSVLLLLGYFCSIDEEYLELNHLVKQKGQERIYFILIDQLDKEISSKDARSLSVTIQNLTSSSIQDCYTTKGLSLKDAQKNVLTLIRKII